MEEDLRSQVEIEKIIGVAQLMLKVNEAEIIK